MPIYEYQCESCGKVSEILVRSAADEAPVCTACGSRKLTKMFSTFGVGKGSPSEGTCGYDGGACSNTG